ncbi:heterokaryon incompatibility protein-domain-containing protein [Lophiotrema nucula]|uniref:Heterokaryon incompatibility protein-domain-containing protein n=1 Tax=Lophiotrema nucula TaxID=690887 RepID=A0A6A5YI21_9PLEO|nr:heterokaryon incompatibility protein-domain-containing protein [Lophiotrema nucula]
MNFELGSLDEALEPVETTARDTVPSSNSQESDLSYRLLPLEKAEKEIRLLKLVLNDGSSKTDNDTEFLRPLRCQLMKIPLHQAPDFNALSYCWGSPDLSRRMSVSIDYDADAGTEPLEVEVSVTESLHEALLHIRRFHEKAYNTFGSKFSPLYGNTMKESSTTAKQSDLFWIDAVSINQKDNFEKSWQVDMMRDIYKSASQVIAWLGLDVELEGPDPMLNKLPMVYHLFEELAGTAYDGYELHGLDVIMPLGQVWHQTNNGMKFASHVEGGIESWLRRRFRFHEGWLCVRDSKSASQPVPCACCGAPESTRSFFTRLIGLASVEWLVGLDFWKRAWILQEVVLSRHLVFQCGLYRINALALYFGLHIISQAGLLAGALGEKRGPKGRLVPYRKPSDLFSIVPPPLKWKYHEDKDDPRSLSELLDFSRNSGLQAGNPLDNIYALLGLVSDPDAVHVEADYSKPCRDVYTNITRYWLSSSGPKVLSFCQWPKLRQGLPSWVPDYSNISAYTGTTIWQLAADFLTTANMPHECSPEAKVMEFPKESHQSDIQSQVLRLGVLKVDTIKSILPRVWAPKEQTEGFIYRMWKYQFQLLASFNYIKRHAHMYADDDDKHTAFAFALTCGGLDRGRSINADHHSSMANILAGYKLITDVDPSRQNWKQAVDTLLPAAVMRGQLVYAIVMAGYIGYPSSEGEEEPHFHFVSEGHRNRLRRMKNGPFLKDQIGTTFTDWFVQQTQRALRIAMQLRTEAVSFTGRTARFTDRLEEMVETPTLEKRRAFITDKGYIGLGPRHVRPGDAVALIHRGHVPFVFRPVHQQGPERHQYQLVGESYVHGLMDREPKDKLRYGPMGAFNPSIEAKTTVQPVPDGEEMIFEVM